PIDGKDVLLTSLVVPIVVDGKFYGISGVDLTLDFLQKLADGVNIYDNSGKLELISYQGIIAGSTGKPELVGKPISEEVKDFEYITAIVQAGKDHITVDGNSLVVYTPVQFGNTETPWSARVTIPYAVITAKANQDMQQMILLAVDDLVPDRQDCHPAAGRYVCRASKPAAGKFKPGYSAERQRHHHET
ncbi:MAG: hypothetical protein NT121_17395, partial [Chloroflexi bacterium]|nr:hypothetical protein [Chloroflexota bacterium]